MRELVFNYYGYDKETHQDCLTLIRSTNFLHVQILNFWFICNNIFFVVCSFFNIFGLNRLRMWSYVAYLLIAIVYGVVLFLFRKRNGQWFRIFVYINILMLSVYSITLSMSQPYLAATMFLVLLVVISLAYMDTMLIMTGILVAICAVFVYSSFKVKPESVAYQDFYNVIVFLALSLALHYTFQRARMKQYVTYHKNVQIQHELEIKSCFDALTGLINRGHFFSLAGSIIKQPHDEYLAICLIDLDGFKQINDKLGHQMGDKAIQITGNTIIDSMQIEFREKWSFTERAIAEKLSFAGRLGGDEFIVLVRGKNGREDVEAFLTNVLQCLNEVKLGDLHGIKASFGVTEILPGENDIDTAYSQADAALYESKRAGKNQINFFRKTEGGAS